MDAEAPARLQTRLPCLQQLSRSSCSFCSWPTSHASRPEDLLTRLPRALLWSVIFLPPSPTTAYLCFYSCCYFETALPGPGWGLSAGLRRALSQGRHPAVPKRAVPGWLESYSWPQGAQGCSPRAGLMGCFSLNYYPIRLPPALLLGCGLFTWSADK